PEKNYYAQGQGYMELYDRDKFSLIYTLNDAPEHLIEKIAWQKIRERGEDELDEETYKEVKENMTYSDLPMALRIKRFDFDREREFIEKVYERVELIRHWIEKETDFYNILNLSK